MYTLNWHGFVTSNNKIVSVGLYYSIKTFSLFNLKIVVLIVLIKLSKYSFNFSKFF